LLRYFRINDPYRLVGLLIVMVIIYMPMFVDPPATTVPELKLALIGEKQNEDFQMYTEVVDYTGPLGAWFQEFVDTLFGRSMLARHITAFLLIFLQSAFIGIMFISRKVFTENTYLPSFLFFLLFLFSFDNLALSNELVGSTFLLLAINNLFKEIEFRVQQDETIFNLGLFISIASLFAFAFSVYLFCAILILVFFTRTTPRKFLLLLFGFLLPHLLAVTITFLSGTLTKLWSYYYLYNLSFSRHTFISAGSLFWLSIIPIAYFIISVVMLNREARFSKYQSQLLQIMFLWIAFSFLYVLYCKDLRPQNLIVFIPALSFLFTHFFLFIRRKKFVEMNAWILFLGIITTGYLARYDNFGSVDYSRLVLKSEESTIRNKRILVLNNNIAYYQNNELATPYLTWDLSQKTFLLPGYYETVTEVYHHFKNDPPEIVIDNNNVLRPFFDRIPELKKQYERRGGNYYRIASN
jgi:hypothetical protein